MSRHIAWYVASLRSLLQRRFWVALPLVCSCAGATDATVGPGAPVATVAVNPPSTTLIVGTQFPLQAVVTDVDGKLVSQPAIVWTVRDTAVASVSATGVVQGRAVGSTEIAANVNGKSGIATVVVQRTPVSSVVVRPTQVNAIPGVHVQLTGLAYDAAGNALSDRPIIWSSSNAVVASVDSTGAVTTEAVGSATIMATVEGVSDSAVFTVARTPVATLTVTPPVVSISVGQATPLTPVPRDSTGNALVGRSVSWTSSDSAVASISAAGQLTALAPGSATITATCEGASAVVSVTVTRVPVGTVSVAPATATLEQNASKQLSATVRDSSGAIVTDRAVTWTSDNLGVATVSGAGLVTGLVPGTATITATSEGKSGVAKITVSPPPPAPVASVAVAPPATTVTVGQTATLVASIKDAAGNALSGRTLTWSSNNVAVATVSASGVVTAAAPGTATITATSEGVSGAATVTVIPVPPAPVASITVTPPSATLTVEQTVTLTATVKDASGNTLTGRVISWISSNAAVATVSKTGVVTGVGVGTATVTATSEGKSVGVPVTVQPGPAATVHVAPTIVSMSSGQTLTITATAADAQGNAITGRPFTWHSTNSSVASVSPTGVVTAKKRGTATITATLDGKSASTAVTVR